MNILKVLLVSIVLSLYGFGCALCQLQTPLVNVAITEKHSSQQIEFDVIWSFHKEFSAETLLTYDKDRNKELSTAELWGITKSFTDYLTPNNYLTFIKYVPNAEAYDNAEYLNFKVSDAKTRFVGDTMQFSYHIHLPVVPQKGYEIYITLFDKQQFFRFNIHNIKLQESQENNSTLIAEGSASFIPFSTQLRTDTLNTSKTFEIFQHTTQSAEQNATGFFAFLGRKMKETKESIFSLTEQIKTKGSISAYFWLLGFSLLYGIIHALGPGHGKSLVAAYFLGNNRSVFKAFSIASLIGVVHTFSAFLLTFVVYYLLNTYLNEYFTDLESVTIKSSAVIIILIALYLLYKRLPKKKPKQPLWSAADPAEHRSNCGCGACQSTTTDLGIILSAGIVPCPGTITIFVFSLSLGAYMIGFLSAVFMSLGMSLVIFVAAWLSMKIRQKASSKHTFRTLLDYGSLLFILMLGVVLFFMS